MGDGRDSWITGAYPRHASISGRDRRCPGANHTTEHATNAYEPPDAVPVIIQFSRDCNPTARPASCQGPNQRHLTLSIATRYSQSRLVNSGFSIVEVSLLTAVYNASSHMSDLPGSRSISTRFRILVEIASRQPSVQQKDVAQELGITVQAVSERIKELVAAGLVVSRGRASYAVTPTGVDWLLRHARELESYSERISRIVRDISVTAALADTDLAAGDRVALEMRDGILRARAWRENDPTSGHAAAHAQAGSDVGITRIEGIIPLSVAETVVATVPVVREEGSRRADTPRLRLLAQQTGFTAALGVEALVALRLAGIEPDTRWAAAAAVVEAASAGVSCLLVCTESELPAVSERLNQAGLLFSVVDLSL